MRRSELFTSIARSFLLAFFGVVLLGAVGCDIFKENSDMYGDQVNRREYRLNAWNPANHAEVHEYKPEGYRYFVLQGSTKYEFKAWLPDSEVTDHFVGRLDEVKKDTRFNGVDIDWLWEMGGGFYACTTPVDPTGESSTRAAITLTALPGAPPPPPLLIVTMDEMKQLRAAVDNAAHARIVRSIHCKYRVAIPAMYQEK